MFTISEQEIKTDSLKQYIKSDTSGALVCFEGVIRNHNAGQHVERLQYEAHMKLAHAQGTQIIRQVLKQYNINKAVCVHRVGMLEIGDLAVWIGVSSAHRKPAFEACQHIIDTVKKQVPIWKKEYFINGESKWLAD